ncbi:MAG: hypothetical protein M1826_007130 [Phylliscum demangeonii]|nr:MAG: hypothetical protein M1826_007130 [Phylliscum demangeonii]
MTSRTISISIPSTTERHEPAPPHTVYLIQLRLPLRSFTIAKRYSDFVALDGALRAQTGGRPAPAPLPPKNPTSTWWGWWPRTSSINAALIEERRKALERYLQAINNQPDDDEDGPGPGLGSAWRRTPAWRAFLNLPSSVSGSSTSLSLSLAAGTSPAAMVAALADPGVWMDGHGDLKRQLREARLHLQARDQATTAPEQHERSAEAKRNLVRAGALIAALDAGLKTQAQAQAHLPPNDDGPRPRPPPDQPRAQALGEGELRRRRDLVGLARKEKDGLEALAAAVAAADSRKASLTGAGGSGSDVSASASAGPQRLALLNSGPEGRNGSRAHGRVLGAARPAPESEHTRQLDNDGLLQLQKQEMAVQDESLAQMARGIVRLKELGVAINEELGVQNDQLALMDEDVTRVDAKVRVAKKRAAKIS